MTDQQQITPSEALDWLRGWERQVAPDSSRRAWYARIIACVEGLQDRATRAEQALAEARAMSALWKAEAKKSRKGEVTLLVAVCRRQEAINGLLTERAEARGQVERLTAALEKAKLGFSNLLEIGRIECLCWGADGCDPHELLLDIEEALASTPAGATEPAPCGCPTRRINTLMTWHTRGCTAERHLSDLPMPDDVLDDEESAPDQGARSED